MLQSIKDLLRSKLGLDRAIGATALTQIMRFVTGPITMLLMIRHFRPEEQGFYYSFVGVIGLQVFLEAGFAQSITQFTSREFGQLRFNRDGLLVGGGEALSRLRSLFQQANRYYRWMATVLVVALMGGGYVFFSSKPSHDVPWIIPWFTACGVAGITFCLTPYWAFLEGCNKVAEVATYRFCSGLIGFFAMASGLMLGFGMYVVVWAAIFNVAVPFIYLGWKWRPLIAQIWRPPSGATVSWRNEIWGFQWRIAGTWMSRYFLESGIAPLAFHLSGPVAAGQVGMTFQVIRMIGGIANTWTVTKIPYWGVLAAKNEWQMLERSWFGAARRNVLFTSIGLICFVAAFPLLSMFWPAASLRFLSLPLVVGFAIGWILYSFWLVSMHYTRALRREPFTFLHIGVGFVFLAVCLAFSERLGVAVIPVTFAFIHLPPAYISLRIRRRIRSTVMMEHCST